MSGFWFITQKDTQEILFEDKRFHSKADALGGNAKMRYEDNSKDEGLVMKGKKVAQWQT